MLWDQLLARNWQVKIDHEAAGERRNRDLVCKEVGPWT
jgi:hypothetical protein